METQPQNGERLRYEAATRARAFEIELFWKRALFFWGFQAAALVAFASTHKDSPGLALGAASFGFVCAVAWTLANRGSTYWYEAWEKKLQSAEILLTGELYGKEEQPKGGRGWLVGRRFSVSRLTIGLSDYAVALWLVALAQQVARPWLYCMTPIVEHVVALAFALGSIIYSIVLGRYSLRRHVEPRAAA